MACLCDPPPCAVTTPVRVWLLAGRRKSLMSRALLLLLPHPPPACRMRALLVRGGAVWQLVGLITRRSQVQILPPLPLSSVSFPVTSLTRLMTEPAKLGIPLRPVTEGSSSPGPPT